MSKHTFTGGIHPPGFKELTNAMATVPAKLPQKVYLPLSQHIGAPCAPIVQVGDEVLKGQKIAEGKGFVTSPIHASISGKVIAVEKKQHPGGNFVDCIVIENDGQDKWADTVHPHLNPSGLSAEELRKIIFEAGIVGMGGAAFPSHVKYAPAEGKKADYVILNGIECEPYLTSDHRLLVEKAERILSGLRYIIKAADADKGIIGIEDNKPDAIALFQQLTAGDEVVSVMPLHEKYPQGSEKQLIFSCTHREVPVGGLPLDAGVIVNNVGTAAAIADAVELGIPLIERIVTVTGTGVKEPANLLVRLGTLFSDLIEQCGGYTGEIEKIISGGMMMGKAVFTDDMPVVKGSSGIVILKKAAAPPRKEYNCVRCAKCVDACPALLEPTTIAKLAKRGLWDEAKSANAVSCIECGCCSYVCPANIPLVQYIRRAKQAIAANAAKAAAAKN